MRLFLIAFMLLATSCSTIFTRRTYPVKIFSNGSNDKAEVDGKTYNLPADITVKRSKENLHIRLYSDTSTTDFQVKPRLHGKFLYGNLLVFWPAAYLIDLTNDKRFHYGKWIILDPRIAPDVIQPTQWSDGKPYFGRDFSTEKGQINLSVSLPHINSFYLQPENEPVKTNTGFWGLSAGLEYYYTATRFVAITGSVNADLFVPLPAPVDYEGYNEFMSSAYLSATHNHKIKRFYVGYGLNYAKNLWRWDDDSLREPIGTMPPPPDSGRKVSTAIGITTNGYYQLGEQFMLGLIYRPTILRVSPDTEFKYEHLISFDIAWRIALNKGGDK